MCVEYWCQEDEGISANLCSSRKAVPFKVLVEWGEGGEGVAVLLPIKEQTDVFSEGRVRCAWRRLIVVRTG